jgi:hypothetical protein
MRSNINQTDERGFSGYAAYEIHPAMNPTVDHTPP